MPTTITRIYDQLGLRGGQTVQHGASDLRLTAPTDYTFSWTFNENRTENVDWGWFVDGTAWITGGVTMTNNTPLSTDAGGVINNGSTLDPQVLHGACPWATQTGSQGSYAPSLNDGRPNQNTLGPGNPLFLPSGSSLLSSNTLNIAQNNQPRAGYVVPITVVDSPPPPGSFRPCPLLGAPKTSEFNISDIDWNQFYNRGISAATVGSSVARVSIEEHAWRSAHYIPDWGSPYASSPNDERIPALNQFGGYANGGQSGPSYGHAFAGWSGPAVLATLIQEDFDKPAWTQHIINMCQKAIDYYEMCRLGRTWLGNGGHYAGRMVLPIFGGFAMPNHAKAAKMRNVTEQGGPGDTRAWFAENTQVFEVVPDPADVPGVTVNTTIPPKQQGVDTFWNRPDPATGASNGSRDQSYNASWYNATTKRMSISNNGQAYVGPYTNTLQNVDTLAHQTRPVSYYGVSSNYIIDTGTKHDGHIPQWSFNHLRPPVAHSSFDTSGYGHLYSGINDRNAFWAVQGAGPAMGANAYYARTAYHLCCTASAWYGALAFISIAGLRDDLADDSLFRHQEYFRSVQNSANDQAGNQSQYPGNGANTVVHAPDRFARDVWDTYYAQSINSGGVGGGGSPVGNIVFRTESRMLVDESALQYGDSVYGSDIVFQTRVRMNVAGSLPSGNWYSTQWSTRKPHKVKRSLLEPGTEANFSHPFRMQDDDMRSVANGGLMQENAEDLFFTLADGLTKIPHDIDDYDPVTGLVEGKLLFATYPSELDEFVYPYWGNAMAPAQDDPAGTYPDHSAVYHLHKRPDSGPTIRSTLANSVPGSSWITGNFSGATDWQLQDGLFTDAMNFFEQDPEGASVVTIPNAPNVNASAFTIFTVVSFRNFNTHDARVISKALGASSDDHVFMLSTLDGSVTVATPANHMIMRARVKAGTSDTDPTTTVYGTTELQTDTWYTVAVTYDGAMLRLYLNGALEGSTAMTGGIRQNSHPVTIGCSSDTDASPIKHMQGPAETMHAVDVAWPESHLKKLNQIYRDPVTYFEPFATETFNPTSPSTYDAEGSDSIAIADAGFATAIIEAAPVMDSVAISDEGDATVDSADIINVSGSDGIAISDSGDMSLVISVAGSDSVAIGDSGYDHRVHDVSGCDGIAVGDAGGAVAVQDTNPFADMIDAATNDIYEHSGERIVYYRRGNQAEPLELMAIVRATGTEADVINGHIVTDGAIVNIPRVDLSLAEKGDTMHVSFLGGGDLELGRVERILDDRARVWRLEVKRF
ncbi:MAG: LamG-like jellyroll fold domain-containing protein [Planctomycetota bacterium]